MAEIIKLEKNDTRINTALNLAEDVFREFQAPFYPEEGVNNFISFIYGEKLRNDIECGNAQIYICMETDEICGMMCIRDKNHISLAFIKKEHQKKGMGRMLFQKICVDHPQTDFTVNASAYGLPFYKKLGFVPTDMEMIEDGIIFTPMKMHFNHPLNCK